MSQASAIRRRRETRLDKRYQPASGARYSKQSSAAKLAQLRQTKAKK